MDGATKIALGIMAAAMIAVIGYICYHEYERRRDIADAHAALDAFGEAAKRYAVVPDAGEVRARFVPDERAQADVAARREQRQRLQPDERCIGATVVLVRGTSYIQETDASGRPVTCQGNRVNRS